MIVNVGETEKGQINQEESGLLKEVCAYREVFCLHVGLPMGQVREVRSQDGK